MLLALAYTQTGLGSSTLIAFQFDLCYSVQKYWASKSLEFVSDVTVHASKHSPSWISCQHTILQMQRSLAILNGHNDNEIPNTAQLQHSSSAIHRIFHCGTQFFDVLSNKPTENQFSSASHRATTSRRQLQQTATSVRAVPHSSAAAAAAATWQQAGAAWRGLGDAGPVRCIDGSFRRRQMKTRQPPGHVTDASRGSLQKRLGCSDRWERIMDAGEAASRRAINSSKWTHADRQTEPCRGQSVTVHGKKKLYRLVTSSRGATRLTGDRVHTTVDASFHRAD